MSAGEGAEVAAEVLLGGPGPFAADGPGEPAVDDAGQRTPGREPVEIPAPEPRPDRLVLDRADGPVATKKVPEEVAKALMQARNQLKNQKGTTMTQKDLASKANVDVKVVADLERTGADFPAMDAVLKLQKAANVRLTGSNIGEPFLGPKKK